MEAQEQAQQAREAIDRLRPRLRELLMLKVREKKSYKEIAEILEVPIGTVQSRISRGKLQLQKIVADRAAGPSKGQEVKHRG